jgi:hypothetical protein
MSSSSSFSTASAGQTLHITNATGVYALDRTLELEMRPGETIFTAIRVSSLLTHCMATRVTLLSK